MSFQSAGFFAFLLVTLLLYFAVPQKIKNPVLLAACWFFYSCTGVKYLLLLLAVTLITYGAALLVENAKTPGARRAFFWLGFALLFANLFFFKYYDLFGKQLAIAAINLGLSYIPPDYGIMVPLGVSFYTFTLSGYLIDVFKNKQCAQRDFVKLALFSSFFPLISAGPIERGGRLMPQFDGPRPFVYENFCRGASRMLWGFLKKFVVANTVAGMVDKVFANLYGYSGPYLLLAALLYSYQLYCDFSSYSDIAIGIAQLLGIETMENFQRPFAARSFGDLWRRWHISLTSWFREYLYFPLGGSRKGTVRTYVNILIIFLASGIWHGTGITFIIWGLLNGLYMIIGRLTARPRAALAQRNVLYRNPFIKAVIQTALVYVLFTSCIVFFRAETLADCAYIYTNLFTGWLAALTAPGTVIETLKTIGIGRVTGLLLVGTITWVELIEWWAARTGLDCGAWLRARKPAKRMPMYYGMLILLALFGVLGSSSFIYFQF